MINKILTTLIVALAVVAQTTFVAVLITNSIFNYL